MGVIAGITFTHNGNFNSSRDLFKQSIKYNSIERLMCLDVRKLMPSPLSHPVVRPLYNGGSVVLRGAPHHLLSMLVDTHTLNSTNANLLHQAELFPFFCNIFCRKYFGTRNCIIFYPPKYFGTMNYNLYLVYFVSNALHFFCMITQ